MDVIDEDQHKSFEISYGPVEMRQTVMSYFAWQISAGEIIEHVQLRNDSNDLKRTPRFLGSSIHKLRNVTGIPTTWSLVIDPLHMYKGRQYVSLFLRLNSLALPLDYIDVAYELQWITEDGLVRTRRKADIRRFDLPYKNGHGFEKFMSYRELLDMNTSTVITFKAILMFCSEADILQSEDERFQSEAQKSQIEEEQNKNAPAVEESNPETDVEKVEEINSKYLTHKSYENVVSGTVTVVSDNSNEISDDIKYESDSLKVEDCNEVAGGIDRERDNNDEVAWEPVVDSGMADVDSYKNVLEMGQAENLDEVIGVVKVENVIAATLDNVMTDGEVESDGVTDGTPDIAGSEVKVEVENEAEDACDDAASEIKVENENVTAEDTSDNVASEVKTETESVTADAEDTRDNVASEIKVETENMTPNDTRDNVVSEIKEVDDKIEDVRDDAASEIKVEVENVTDVARDHVGTEVGVESENVIATDCDEVLDKEDLKNAQDSTREEVIREIDVETEDENEPDSSTDNVVRETPTEIENATYDSVLKEGEMDSENVTNTSCNEVAEGEDLSNVKDDTHEEAESEIKVEFENVTSAATYNVLSESKDVDNSTTKSLDEALNEEEVESENVTAVTNNAVSEIEADDDNMAAITCESALGEVKVENESNTPATSGEVEAKVELENVTDSTNENSIGKVEDDNVPASNFDEALDKIELTDEENVTASATTHDNVVSETEIESDGPVTSTNLHSHEQKSVIKQEEIDQAIRDIIADLWVTKAKTNTKVIISDVEIPVHSYILKARAPVFRDHYHFNGESAPIFESDTDLEIMQGLLQYCYTNDTELFNDYNKTVLLLEASDKYDFSHLQKKCIETLMTLSDKDTFHTTFNIMYQREFQKTGSKYTAQMFLRDLNNLRNKSPNLFSNLDYENLSSDQRFLFDFE